MSTRVRKWKDDCGAAEVNTQEGRKDEVSSRVEVNGSCSDWWRGEDVRRDELLHCGF